MTNEVIWTKLVLDRFIQLANLTEEEEIVIRTRAAGWSRVKQAMELNISISGIDRIISRLRKKTGPGYYDIAAGATLSGSAAGTITLTAYQDGVAIPGMTASQTVKAAGDIVPLGVSGIIRNYCTKPVSTLTIVVSGMAATGTNLAIDITKQ